MLNQHLKHSEGNGSQSATTLEHRSMHIDEALQMQIEVQRRLLEQLEGPKAPVAQVHVAPNIQVQETIANVLNDLEDDVPPEERYVYPENEDEMEEFTAFIFRIPEKGKWKPFGPDGVCCTFCGKRVKHGFLSVLQHSESYSPSVTNVGNLIAKHRAFAWFLKENVPANLEAMVRKRDVKLSKRYAP